jgi:hypothetical protein
VGTWVLINGNWYESIDEFSPDGDENDFCEFSGVLQFLIWCCLAGVTLTCSKVAMKRPSRGGLQHPSMLRLPLKAPLLPPKAVQPMRGSEHTIVLHSATANSRLILWAAIRLTTVLAACSAGLAQWAHSSHSWRRAATSSQRLARA